MALVKDDKGGPAPPNPPRRFLDLLWDLTGNRKRRRGLVEIVFCFTLAGCLLLCVGADAIVAAARGLNGLTLTHLVPTGLCGSAYIIFTIIKSRRKVRHRNRGAIPGGKPTKESSPDRNRRKNRRGRKQKQLLPPRRRAWPCRWRPGLPLLLR